MDSAHRETIFQDPERAASYRSRQVESEGWISWHGELLLAAVEPRAGERALDLACGAGYPALILAERVGPRGHVLGIDLSEPMLAGGRAAAQERGLANVTFQQGDVHELPVESAAVDIVTSNLGLHLFRDRPRALAEMVRALKPGGRLALSTPLAGTLAPFYRAFERALDGQVERGRYRRAPGFAPEMLEDLLRGAGLADYGVSQRTYTWAVRDLAELEARHGTYITFTSRNLLPEGPARAAVWARTAQWLAEEAGDDGMTRVPIIAGCAFGRRPS